MIETAEQNHFDHYEISNFSTNGLYSKHNSNYWNGNMYLGIGPSAHSYNIISRQWNISDNAEYIKRISENEEYFKTEKLDIKTRYNEYVMTGLRTKWGISLNHIETNFGNHLYNQIKQELLKFVETGKIVKDRDIYVLSAEGKLIADYIISELFAD